MPLEFPTFSTKFSSERNGEEEDGDNRGDGDSDDRAIFF